MQQVRDNVLAIIAAHDWCEGELYEKLESRSRSDDLNCRDWDRTLPRLCSKHDDPPPPYTGIAMRVVDTQQTWWQLLTPAQIEIALSAVGALRDGDSDRACDADAILAKEEEIVRRVAAINAWRRTRAAKRGFAESVAAQTAAEAATVRPARKGKTPNRPRSRA
ncbi:MAG: hypothetical protein ACYDCQ_03410 [Dehalococcoidia bacterium]